MSLTAKQISFQYAADKPVLHDLTFNLTEHSRAALIGSNGSGKTTLLKCLLGFLKPQQGLITLDNRPLSSYSARLLARMIAYVPQGIFPVFSTSVFDFVIKGRAPYLKGLGFETKADQHIAQENMEMTETWHLKTALLEELSGGEKQRVLLAKALTQTPRILLLDEPTAHLDISYQIQMLSLIKQLHEKKKITTLCILHDFHLATEFSQQVFIMNQGRIASQGSPHEVFTEEQMKRFFQVHVGIDPNPYTTNPRLTFKRGF